MCVCSQVCVHTCVPGWIGTCRGLSTWAPRSQGWGPHHTRLGVQCTLHVWASLDTQAWMRCGSTQVGMGRDRCSLGTHQAPHNSASALVQRNCQMGKLRAAACLRPPGFLPVNPGEPPVPHPPHKMGLRQESAPPKVRDGKGSAADHGSTLECDSYFGLVLPSRTPGLDVAFEVTWGHPTVKSGGVGGLTAGTLAEEGAPAGGSRPLSEPLFPHL